jgi:hypothetical protein
MPYIYIKYIFLSLVLCSVTRREISNRIPNKKNLTFYNNFFRFTHTIVANNLNKVNTLPKVL